LLSPGPVEATYNRYVMLLLGKPIYFEVTDLIICNNPIKKIYRK